MLDTFVKEWETDSDIMATVVSLPKFHDPNDWAKALQENTRSGEGVQHIALTDAIQAALQPSWKRKRANLQELDKSNGWFTRMVARIRG